MSRLGIAIMAYNRPHYLARCLETLVANDLTDADVHLWQDGNVDAIRRTQLCAVDSIEESVSVFERAGLQSATVHRSDVNLCCAAQRAQLMPYMAERYETFICMDDDVVLSPWAIRHMRTLFAQYAGDGHTGSISPGFKLECPRGGERKHRDKVKYTRGHFWCEGWWRDTWARVWPWYEAYYERVRHVPYRDIGTMHAQIQEWSHGLGLEGEYAAGPSSDTALARGLILAGYERMRFCVNRATGIGDEGLHCYPELMAKLGAGHQPIHTWDDEGGIMRFELVTP